ncbi:E3 ubiquitin-protein ligase SMURF2 isoform X2 [Lepeophtheirus salmonis]|uniref:E3 ubiquitin-protein ligase SMURF2 isoform X2 n=1 Tax=Lepeophtheirus salmonis TaxID=72036 RepID=UPI001AE521E9|nr:E3 ubiquitin-protein ligase SMURF2-like isoform X2 [Lepeophtheirus salmonis]
MEIRGTKIRLTILCARNLAKRDLFRLPDPFARVDVDATGVTHVSEAAKNTTDPKWNTHYDLHLSPNESFTLSVWNDKKMHKKTYNSGFLGCVRLMGNAIQRIKDTGYQRLDLVSDTKIGLPVKGQIVISLLSRDGHGSLNAVVDTLGNLTCSNDLPEGWEERRTPSGRVYYVNHVRRTTQWARPTEPASCGTTRRGDRGGTLSITNSSKNNNLSKTTTTTTTSSTPTSEGANSLPIASSHALTGNGTDNLPAVNNQDSPSSLSEPFSSLQPRRHQITQPDNLPPGYIMKTTEHGQIYYIHEGTGQTTWHDPRLTRALTSNEELNLGPLPPGWEQRVTDSSRPYFVNHNNHTTQFSDPRIPLLNDANNHHHDDNSPTNPSRGTSKNESATNVLPTNPSLSPETNDTHSNVRNSEPADSPSTSNEAPLSVTCSSSGSTSTTTSSTPSSLAPSNITNTTVSNVRATTSNNTVLRPRGEVIQQLSPFPVLPVSSSSSIISSPPPPPPPQTTSSSSSSVPNTPPVIGGPRCWPQDPLSIALHGGGTEFLPKFKKDLVAKIKVLRSELNNLQPQNGYCPLEVSRQEVFEDSYRQIVKMRYKVMRKKLRVKFRNEEGLDYGGVAREWLYLLSHEMLNPYYGLFQYSSEDVYTLQINPDSAVNPDHLSYFHFVGRIIGMAVFHGHFIDGCFTTPFYKMMLNKPINLDDIEAVDPDLHKSLKWILSNDISGIIDNTFSVEHEAFGLTKVYELKENGKDIPVNESNKVEYVKLYVQFRWCLGIEQQFLSLQKGFNELIPQNLLKPFDEKELELVIGGIGTIDIVDWKNHTRLKQCDAETPVVQWFWAIVDSYSSEMRARLLQFVTGSSRVPLQGFKDLQGSTGQTGPRHFTLHLTNAPVDSLPKARTCFNRLDLPAYPSFEIMAEKLTQAVEETCGFAVE